MYLLITQVERTLGDTYLPFPGCIIFSTQRYHSANLAISIPLLFLYSFTTYECFRKQYTVIFTIYFSVWLLWILCKWNHTVSIPFSLASVAQLSVFLICRGWDEAVCHLFSLFCKYTTIYFYVLLWWTFGSVSVSAVTNTTTMNITLCCLVNLWNSVSRIGVYMGVGSLVTQVFSTSLWSIKLFHKVVSQHILLPSQSE